MLHLWTSVRALRSCANRRAERGIALVIDGDRVFRHFAMRALHSLGCAAVGLHDGEEALRWLQTTASAPVLISCDTHLRNISGFDLCLAVRAHAKSDLACAPILCVSSGTNDDDRFRALQSGADAFLAKPVRPESFIDAAHGLMRSRNDTRVSSTSWIRDRGMM